MKTGGVISVESRMYVEKMVCVCGTKKPKHNEKTTSLFFLESLGVESSPNNSISLKFLHCVCVWEKRCQSSFIECIS